MDWAFEVETPRSDVFERLYAGANKFGAETFPAMMQEAMNSNDQAKQIEAAQLADLIMYQLRVALGTGIGLVAATTPIGGTVRIHISGSASAQHKGPDAVSVTVVNVVSTVPSTTQESEASGGTEQEHDTSSS